MFLSIVLLFFMYRVYGVLPEFIVMGRVVGKDFSRNLIVIKCEFIYNWSGWETFSEILNGSSPNIDALRDLRIGDYVIGVAYGTLPDKNGWYKGWITIAKLSNDREYVTDIYGDIYNVKPFLEGFRIEYSSVPENCSECLCPVKYVMLTLYDRNDNLLLNKIMYRGDSLKYIYGHDNGYAGAYNIYVKFYNGSFQKCIGPQGHCIFTIHFEEIAVKFRGIIVDASSQYDVIVRIDEVLLDPEGKLSPGKYAHIDIACSTSESNVDWPLQKGDRIEVYAKHFSYCDWNYKGYRIVIAVWIYSRDNPYDGYLKKIGGVEFNADIWVDRGCGSTYYIGDPIKIYFKVNLKAYVEIIDEFPDGSKKLLTWGWAEPNKVYCISGKIGPPDGYRIFHIYAEDESGNKVHSQCYINVRSKEMPDLTISFIEYSPKNPSEGDTVTFDISITNIGDSASGKFKIALKIDGKLFKEIEVSTLQPGEEKHISFTWTAVKGDHRIEIIVDSQNSVVEKDEQNNVKTIYIYVEENNPPVAVIDSISPNPAVKGDTIYFKGHGYDPDGDQIVEYEWKSSIDGFLSNKKEFSVNKLSIGKHIISFRVKDSRGRWSDWTTYIFTLKYVSDKDIEKFRLLAQQHASFLKSISNFLKTKNDPDKYLQILIEEEKKFSEELVSIKDLPKSILIEIFKASDIDDVDKICKSIIFSFKTLSDVAFWSNFWINADLRSYIEDLVKHIDRLATSFQREAEFWSQTDGLNIDFDKLKRILREEKEGILKLKDAVKTDLNNILQYFEEKPYKPIIIADEILREGEEKTYYFELWRDLKYIDIEINQEYMPGWWEFFKTWPTYRLELWWYNPMPDLYNPFAKPEWQKIWTSKGMSLKIGEEYKTLLGQISVTEKPHKFKLIVYPEDFGGDINIPFILHVDGPKTQKVKIILKYGPEEKRYIDIYSYQAEALKEFQTYFIQYLNVWTDMVKDMEQWIDSMLTSN